MNFVYTPPTDTVTDPIPDSVFAVFSGTTLVCLCMDEQTAQSIVSGIAGSIVVPGSLTP